MESWIFKKKKTEKKNSSLIEVNIVNSTLCEVCSVCSEERVREVFTVNGDASLLPTVKEKPLLPQVGVVLAQEVNLSSGGVGVQ